MLAHDGKDKEWDYIVVGGGPSGLFLSRLLADKYPNKNIIIINKGSKAPWFPFKIYFLNVLAVVLNWFYPKFQYSCQNLKRQFINCSYLGGNSNINAGVAVIPTKDDIEKCLQSTFLPLHTDFFASKWMSILSSDVPHSDELNNLSLDVLNLDNIMGGKIRVFAQEGRFFFRKRLHPDSLVEGISNIGIIIGEADHLLYSVEEKNKVIGVRVKEDGVPINLFSNEVILCCGAIESPKLLIRSGCGPEDLLKKASKVDKSVYINKEVGNNLMDHYVQRFQVKVPAKYNFTNWYPCILGYKYRYKDICFGFGKIKPSGNNIFSFATAKCRKPGRIEFTQETKTLEPVLVPQEEDTDIFWSTIDELRKMLESKLDIHFVDKTLVGKPFSPNWHYCGTLAMGRCVDEECKVIGLKNIRCADLSILKEICSMNTQMMSYFVAYAVATKL